MTERRGTLIVDDQPNIRLLLRLALQTDERFGHVTEAASAAEALAAARVDHPRVIILDDQMPEGSGMDVLPDLRRACPSARIIVFTGNSDTICERALQAGADACVSKLIDLRDLADLAAA